MEKERGGDIVIKRKYVVICFLVLVSVILGSLFYASITQAQTTYTDSVEITILDWTGRNSGTTDCRPCRIKTNNWYAFPFAFNPKAQLANIVDLWITITGVSTSPDIAIKLNDNRTDYGDIDFDGDYPTRHALQLPQKNSLRQGINILNLTATDIEAWIFRMTLFIEYEYQTGEGVGGFYIPIDKFNLIAPYLALVSTIILVASISVAIIKHRKKQ